MSILNLDLKKKAYKWDCIFDKILYNLDKYFAQYKILYISNINPYINNKKIKWVYIDNIYVDWQYSHINWFNIIYNNY